MQNRDGIKTIILAGLLLISFLITSFFVSRTLWPNIKSRLVIRSDFQNFEYLIDSTRVEMKKSDSGIAEGVVYLKKGSYSLIVKDGAENLYSRKINIEKGKPQSIYLSVEDIYPNGEPSE